MPLHYTNTTQRNYFATQKPRFMHRYSANIICRTDAVKKDGKAAVSLQCFINGVRVVIPVGVDIEPMYWLENERRVKLPKNLKQLEVDYNLLIMNAEAKASKIFIEHRTSGVILTKDVFKKKFLNEDINVNFLKFAYDQLNQESHNMGMRAILHHMRVFKLMQQYQPDWLMVDINYTNIKGFNDWVSRKFGYKTNYMAKIHGTIKKFTNIARKQGIPIADPYSNYKISKVKTQPVYLTGEELRRMIALRSSHDLPPTHLEVLSAYLFAATSGGFRISDWYRLTEENIVGKEIVFVPHKTRKFKTKIIRLEITDIGTEILNGRTGKLFNLPSEQKVNMYLKDLAILAEINKRITSHTARHTFATQYLEHGGKIERLQLILGHSKLEETMVYSHISDKTVSQSMRVINVWKLQDSQTPE